MKKKKELFASSSFYNNPETNPLIFYVLYLSFTVFQ